MTDPRIQLADTISALVDPYQHAESYTLTLRSAIPDSRTPAEIRVNRIRLVSLLDQLAYAVRPSFAAAPGGLHGGYASKPTAQLAAVDRLAAIARALYGHPGFHPKYREIGWLEYLNLPRRDNLEHDLRALPGAADIPRDLVKDAARWLTWAQIVTGWETPPRTLREPCPLCGIRGVIKVRADADHVEGAWCTSCDNTWSDDAEIAMLAQHVRWCNGELETQEMAI